MNVMNEVEHYKQMLLGIHFKVTEKPVKYTFADGNEVEYTTHEIDKDEYAVLCRILAHKKHRILLPNSITTMDYVPERINVIIDKKDGVWQVTDVRGG